MEIEKTIKYVCSYCKKKYDFEKEALNCEQQDKVDLNRDRLTIFVIRDEHIKLLKEMNVEWYNCEFGAPCIDPKRPYGNSDGVDDVARVIGLKKTKDNVEFDDEESKDYDDINEYLENCEWKDNIIDYLYNLHKDMKIVLQIVLSASTFKTGTYVRESDYTLEWKYQN